MRRRDLLKSAVAGLLGVTVPAGLLVDGRIRYDTIASPRLAGVVRSAWLEGMARARPGSLSWTITDALGRVVRMRAEPNYPGSTRPPDHSRQGT